MNTGRRGVKERIEGSEEMDGMRPEIFPLPLGALFIHVQRKYTALYLFTGVALPGDALLLYYISKPSTLGVSFIPTRLSSAS